MENNQESTLIAGVSATYSAEDNKLRIYFESRISDEEYNEVRKLGFKWAPKQGLSVATWTPHREDLCLKFAGEITPEGTTLIERAEAKAARLDDLATKRASQAVSFEAAARQISERFAYGQPILVGHHSERKARKDKERMESAQDKASQAASAVDYWNYRAEGVERHANRLNRDDVRARRIKKLLADLRDKQRTIIDHFKTLKRWEKVSNIEDEAEFKKMVEFLAGDYRSGANGYWSDLRDGKISHCDVCDLTTERLVKINTSGYWERWVSHLLNRLAFERSQLGSTARFEGDLTPVILQAFAREHGTEKPKAKKDGEQWTISSTAPFPFHLGEGDTVTQTGEAWRDMMQAFGYEVVIKEKREGKKQVCSLINPTNEDAQKLQELWNIYGSMGKYGGVSDIKEVTQSHYSERSKGDYSPYNSITLSQKGLHLRPRFNKDSELVPVCRVRSGGGTGGLYGADAVIVLTDKPQKPLPLDLDALIVEAKELAKEKAKEQAA